MRFSLIVLLLASVCLAFAPMARAESNDPGEVFLSAYMTAQQAEKLESQGSYRPALAKYRFAGSVLDQLQARHSEWNPLVVDYRKKKVAEAIQKLEEKIAAEAPIATPTPASQLGVDPNAPPGTNDAPHTDTSGDAMDRAAREMRAQMAAIKDQLEQSRQQLEAARKEKARIASQLEEATGKLNHATDLSKAQIEKVKKAEAAKAEAANAEAAKAREQEASVL